MGIPYDVPFYAKLLDAAATRRDLAALRRTQGRLVILGLANHRFLCSKLCAAYARCYCLREARHFIGGGSPPSLFLLNSLLRASPPRDALLLFHHSLARRSSAPDARSFAAALRSAAEIPSIRFGRLLHGAAVVNGFLFPNASWLDDQEGIIVFNSLVALYSKCGDVSDARKVFDSMPHRTVVSWTAIISGCGAHGLAEEAVALFERMIAEGEVQPDAAAMTAVLAACARGGPAELEVGLRVFAKMAEGSLGEGARPAVEHYTCMVDMLGRAGRLEAAENLVEEMDDVEPDDALWAALLGACRAHRRLDVAERIANRIYSRSGLEPGTGPIIN